MSRAAIACVPSFSSPRLRAASVASCILPTLLLGFLAGCNYSEAIETYQAKQVLSSADRARQLFENATIPTGLLVASPTKIDLGEVPKGGKKDATFWVMNPTSERFEITEIESSCDCLTIHFPKQAREAPLPLTIGPSEKVQATAKLVLEPHFSGRLWMDVKAIELRGKAAFFLNVVVVVPES